MLKNYLELIQAKLDNDNYDKLMALENEKLHQFVAEAIQLCEPDSVYVCSDSDEDIAYIRELAIKNNEEIPLKMEGHTAHFEGYYDQARDKKNTRYLVPKGMDLGSRLNSIERDKGLEEINGILKGIMKGSQMLVRFFCLGPTQSEFSISGVQVTDSAYVGHSEDILYRSGYEQFKRLGGSGEFFRVLHSAGELENNVSKNVDQRRIYIDLQEDLVYSVNTQYAGNTVGFKKLALRLAIRKADREGWLAEHMFVMGSHGPNGRVTYFTGAFPSFCGKTSTSMIEGETIIGDDIAYLRRKDGRAHAVNVECGIFGVIGNVNAEDDPLIWKALTTPGEVIFSNILVVDGVPRWLGDGREEPHRGINFSGEWFPGKTDAEGQEIPPAHKNARYTVSLSALPNRDPKADDPEGVPIGGVIYGGRDSDTSVPVKQAFDWEHGVITMGASLESETTAATLGSAGVRAFQPMSNLDFVSLPLGKYINNHLAFTKGLENPPLCFAVNYFLKGDDGKYITGMNDKRVWVKWMELRVHNDVQVIKIPTGLIPLYEDLKKLFKQVLNKDYTPEDYIHQFTLRIPENLEKIERIENIYRNEVTDTPDTVFEALNAQRQRLLAAQKEHGDYVSPLEFTC